MRFDGWFDEIRAQMAPRYGEPIEALPLVHRSGERPEGGLVERGIGSIFRRVLVLALASSAAAVSSPPAGAATASYLATGRVSVTSSGAQKAQDIGGRVRTDSTGRFVAFTSTAALAEGDTNGLPDVYLRDRMGGTTTRVSLTDSESQIDGATFLCGMSRDARFVGFTGHGSGLSVPGSSNQIYLRDRTSGTTTAISVSSDEVPSTSGADSGITTLTPCPISDDGRYVAFVSSASSLAAGDNNTGKTDIFRRDLQLGTTERASVSTGGSAKANGAANEPAMSANGATIAFESAATNLVAGDTNAANDVFVHLFNTGGTFRMSTKAGGGQVLASSGVPALSADGQKVAFTSNATDLVAGDTNNKIDVFVRNRATDTVVRGSVMGANSQLPVASGAPSLSDDGTKLTFTFYYPDVVVDDANQSDDIYRRDLAAGSTTLVSEAMSTATGNEGSGAPMISGDGTTVAFYSFASDLVRNDTNGSADVFVRDFQQDLTPFATPAALIQQQYADFEGRQPTAAELTEWKARFSNGERTPDELIDALAHGTTWSAKRAPLTRLYWAYFLRAPDSSGMTYWTNQLTNGKKLSAVAKQFSTSSEFQTKYGSLSNQAFVTKIYQNIFNRDPDPGGLAYWTNKLATKQKTRGDVMVSFSESNEGKRVLAPQTDTVLIYLGMLRTMPTPAIMLEGIQALRDQGYPPEIVAESVRDQAGYAARVDADGV